MKHGTHTVTAYARAFKALCDQLYAIGHRADEIDKVHWFFRGLGLDFSNFSTAHMHKLFSLASLTSSLKLRVLNFFKNL